MSKLAETLSTLADSIKELVRSNINEDDSTGGIAWEGPNAQPTEKTLSNDPNVATTDQNLTMSSIFQQVKLPSLARQICNVVQIKGSSGGIYAVRQKLDGSNNIEIVRKNFGTYESDPIKTSITPEAAQDMIQTYGKDAPQVIGTMLRSIANVQENKRCLEYIDNKAYSSSAVVLDDPNNTEVVYYNIMQKINKLILLANTQHIRTYESWAVVPFQYLAAMLGVYNQAAAGLDHIDEAYHRSLLVTKFGLCKMYINPDTHSKKIYVGLRDDKDPSRSSLFFADYASDIRTAIDPESGDYKYFIFNRFGIEQSPLHNSDDPMLFKFEITDSKNLDTKDINNTPTLTYPKTDKNP